MTNIGVAVTVAGGTLALGGWYNYAHHSVPTLFGGSGNQIVQRLAIARRCLPP